MVGVIFRLLLSVAILGVIASQVNVETTLGHISRIGFVGFIAAGMFLDVLALPAGLRWRSVISATGSNVSIGWALRGVLIGLFFNQLLPSSIGGDVFRSWLAVRTGMGIGPAVRSVVLDRVMGVGMNLAFSAMALPFLYARSGSTPVIWIMTAAVAAASAGFLLVHVADFLPLSRLVSHSAHISRPRRAINRAIEEMIMIGPDARRSSRQPIVHASSIIVLIGHLGTIFVEARLIGANIEFASIMLVVPAALLVASIPMSFAGWGLREGIMIAAFGLVGIPADLALAISVLYGLTLAAGSAVGGVFWLVGGRTPKPDVKVSDAG
jgi:uncharacterized protein (TIRG00374 family)